MDDVREFSIIVTNGSPKVDAEFIRKVIESRLILAGKLTYSVHVVEKLRDINAD